MRLSRHGARLGRLRMAHPSEVVTRPALNPPTIILRRRAIEPRADPGQRIDRAVAGAVRMIADGDIDPAKGGATLAHGLGEFPRHQIGRASGRESVWRTV